VVWQRRVEVRGPDLRLWRVGRDWSLWRPRMRRVRVRLDDAWNLGDLFDDLSFGAAAAVVIFLFVLLTSPLAGISVFFAEWMLALLLIPLAAAYRLAFRRPWRVYAESVDGRDLAYTSITGWTASGQVVAETAEHIRRTGAPPESWRRVGDPVDQGAEIVGPHP
jgi:hypothetical protein